MRVWLSTFARAGSTHEIAQSAEKAGFYGIMLTDSQILVADPFVELTAAAEATKNLRLGTCATNLVSRHPTVVAAMAATLQQRSGGRMVLGIARGDSALTKVGLHPLTVQQFGTSLAQVRRLLRGEPGEFDGDEVGLAWLDPRVPSTPVIGIASGPHAIDAVARNADGLILQVGSDPSAVARGVQQARSAQVSPNFTIAAYVIVGLQRPGDSLAIDGVTRVLARMADSALAHDDSAQARAAQEAADTYSLAAHGLDWPHESVGRVEDYAVLGDAAQCIDHLQSIATSGCDDLVVILGSVTTSSEELLELIDAFGQEVLPSLSG